MTTRDIVGLVAIAVCAVAFFLAVIAAGESAIVGIAKKIDRALDKDRRRRGAT
jgi:hypothetical protein